MSELHVCVDMITVLYSRTSLIGCRAGCMITAANTFVRGYHVAPESEKAYPTAFSNLVVLKMVFAIGSYCRLLA